MGQTADKNNSLTTKWQIFEKLCIFKEHNFTRIYLYLDRSVKHIFEFVLVFLTLCIGWFNVGLKEIFGDNFITLMVFGDKQESRVRVKLKFLNPNPSKS